MRVNSRGLRWTEFPPSPELGDPAALSPAFTRAVLRGGPRGRDRAGVALRSRGGRPGRGWRRGPPLAPAFSARSPRPGAGPAQAAPRAAQRPAAALAASHPGRASSGKARPRAGAPLPPAPPSVRAACTARRARSEGAAPGGGALGDAGPGGRQIPGRELRRRRRRRAARPGLCIPGTCLALRAPGTRSAADTQ